MLDSPAVWRSGRLWGFGVGVAWWAAVAVVGLCGRVRATPESGPPPVRNLLLIVVDTLRADHVEAYGGAVDTPVMDGLAARGVLFERAYSHIPITGPSHSSLFTGLLPFDHGVRNNDQILAAEPPYFLWAHYSDPHEPYTPPDERYPEVRVVAGGIERGTYRTDGRARSFDFELPSGVTKVLLEPLGDHDLSRAFELKTIRVTDDRVEVRPPDSWRPSGPAAGGKPQGRFPAALELVNRSYGPVGVSLRIACKEVLELAEIRRRYVREVEFADREIGRLLDGLRSRELLDETLVVFVADHGEGLGDHGLVGHISQLYEIRSDPGELRDLAAGGRLEMGLLQSILGARLKAATKVVVDAELDGDEIESLRALGYVH